MEVNKYIVAHLKYIMCLPISGFKITFKLGTQTFTKTVGEMID